MNALEQIIEIDKAGEAVEDHCECGAPRSEHTYWDDRIYDVNGYTCPCQTFRQDYRYSKVKTERKRLEAKAARLQAFGGSR